MDFKRNLRVWLGILLLIFVFVLPFLTPFQKYLSIPNEIVTVNNQSPIELPNLGDSVNVHTTDESMYAIDSSIFYPKETGNSNILYENTPSPRS